MDSQLVAATETGINLVARGGTILAVVTVMSLLVHFVIARLKQKSKDTHHPWDDAALLAAEVPAQVLVWILGVEVFVHAVYVETGISILQRAGEVRAFLVILIVSWFFFRLLHKFEEAAEAAQKQRKKAHKEAAAKCIADNEAPVEVDSGAGTDYALLARTLRILVFIVTFLILLGKLGYSPAALLTFGGIGGIIAGFAAKDLLANVFGGLMIFLDRPFARNDKIRSPDRNIEGVVTKVGWRLTEIQTVDMRKLYVPNAIFAAIAVENRSRLSCRLITTELEFPISGPADASRIVSRIRQVVSECPDVLRKVPSTVSIDRISPERATVLLHVYVRDLELSEYYRVKESLLLNAAAIVHEQGGSIETAPVRKPGILRNPAVVEEQADEEADLPLAGREDATGR